MTGPVPPLPPVGGPEGPPGPERISLGKAAVLLVVAVIVGVLCLQVGARPTVDTGTSSSASVTTTTVPPRTTTTTTTAPKPNPALKVVVTNGSSVNGAAAYFTAKLEKDGWTTLTPSDATPVTSSAVYFATGQQRAAATVATDLGLASSDVHPIATATAAQGVTGADVVVVVGPDLATQVPSGAATTTTAATGGSGTATAG